MRRIYPKGTKMLWGTSSTDTIPFINYAQGVIGPFYNDKVYKIYKRNVGSTTAWSSISPDVIALTDTVPVKYKRPYYNIESGNYALIPDAGNPDLELMIVIAGDGITTRDSDPVYLTLRARTDASQWLISNTYATPPYSASTPIDTFYYDNAPHSVWAEPKTAYLSTLSDFVNTRTIKYNGVATAPTEIGAYKVTLDLAGSNLHPSATGIALGYIYICNHGAELSANKSSINFGKATSTEYTVGYSSGQIQKTDVRFINSGDTVLTNLKISWASGNSVFVAEPANFNTRMYLGDTLSVAIAPKTKLTDGEYIDTMLVKMGTTVMWKIPVYFVVGDLVAVTINPISHVTTSTPAGTFNVSKGSQFDITLIPDADYSLKYVKISTGDTEMDKNLTVTHNSNGTVRITFKNVTKTFTLKVEGVSPAANEDIAGDAIWTEGSTLYIRTAKPSPLTIYTVTGSTHTRQTLPAGETSFTLPRGLYIINVGSTVRKAVIK